LLAMFILFGLSSLALLLTLKLLPSTISETSDLLEDIAQVVHLKHVSRILKDAGDCSCVGALALLLCGKLRFYIVDYIIFNDGLLCCGLCHLGAPKL
jgi:hypothetical protein